MSGGVGSPGYDNVPKQPYNIDTPSQAEQKEKAALKGPSNPVDAVISSLASQINPLNSTSSMTNIQVTRLNGGEKLSHLLNNAGKREDWVGGAIILGKGEAEDFLAALFSNKAAPKAIVRPLATIGEITSHKDLNNALLQFGSKVLVRHSHAMNNKDALNAEIQKMNDAGAKIDGVHLVHDDDWEQITLAIFNIMTAQAAKTGSKSKTGDSIEHFRSGDSEKVELQQGPVEGTKVEKKHEKVEGYKFHFDMPVIAIDIAESTMLSAKEKRNEQREEAEKQDDILRTERKRDDRRGEAIKSDIKHDEKTKSDAITTDQIAKRNEAQSKVDKK